MNIQRYFTKTTQSVWDLFTYEKFSHNMKHHKTGEVIAEIADIEVPSHWSLNARVMVATKYFRKAGIPAVCLKHDITTPDKNRNGGVPYWLRPSIAAPGETKTIGETSVRQVVHRIVGHITYVGFVNGYFEPDPVVAIVGGQGTEDVDISAEDNAKAFYDEMVYMFLQQVAVPNSPQWFNTGLWWAYGITGPAQGHAFVDLLANTRAETKTNGVLGGSVDDAKSILAKFTKQSPDAYSRVQAHACYILSLNDTLMGEQGIIDWYNREARIFKYGSGSGTNASSLRSFGEKLSGGGTSSGAMSWIQTADRSAGAIKSGGTCLAPHTLVYTATGPTPVAKLAGTEFVALSYDPPAGRFKAKRATAWLSGSKQVVRVTTDKGCFDTSWDHPFKLSTGEYVNAADLKPGQSLFACSIDQQHGHLRVHLKNGHKGKQFLHVMVAEDVMGYELSFPDAIVDHADGDKLNCSPSNLEIKSQSAHAHRHGTESARDGTHVFQLNAYPKTGSNNGMHSTSEFWNDSSRATAYREQKSTELLERGNAAKMQDAAASQKMLNLGYRLINAGHSIDTFDQYIKARRQVVGKIASISQVKSAIESRFGTYPNFLIELAKNNHRVTSVEPIGESDVYDVQIDCPTDDDRSEATGHNFVIWPDHSPVGSGVVVHNTRRAAKMVCLDLDHPDIFSFIGCKQDSEVMVASMSVGSSVISRCCQEIMDCVGTTANDFLLHNADKYLKNPQGFGGDVPAGLTAIVNNAKVIGIPSNYLHKAISLRLQGVSKWPGDIYDTHFEGKAYAAVPYQNANHSVRIPFEFYKAVDHDQDWALTARTTGKTVRVVKARELEHQISSAAWFSGDPGVQYHTNINDWNTTPNDGMIRGSNPCSEYVHLDDTACNLASMRLTAFYDGTRFDFEGYEHAADLWMVALDITNTMAHLPDEATAIGTYMYRNTGLGYADLGALLMSMGIPYNSLQGLATTGLLTALMCGRAHLTSAKLARSLGSYPRYAQNAEQHQRVYRNHLAACNLPGRNNKFEGLHVEPMKISWEDIRGIVGDKGADVMMRLEALWVQAGEISAQYGFRNAQMTLLAPTGTIALVMDCETTGIEPMFAHATNKILVGGGSMDLLISSAVKMGLNNRGVPHEVASQIIKLLAEGKPFPRGNIKYTGGFYIVTDELTSVFAAAMPCAGIAEIPWVAHIRMMAAAQSFLCGAISKTINMPIDSSIDDVSKANRLGHDLGCKAVALYRDRSKLSQPLNAKEEQVAPPATNAATTNDAIVSPVISQTRVRLGWMREPGIDVAVGMGMGTLYVKTTRYPNGKLGEIWLTYSGDQGIIQALISSCCKTANIAIQFGTPPEAIIASWIDSRFEPFGMVNGHPYIKTATSILNLAGRVIAHMEFGDTSILTVKPDSTADDAAQVSEVARQTPIELGAVTMTGLTCPACGSSKYVNSGAGCKRCTDCGHSDACG